jgi:hypothetical protein
LWTRSGHTTTTCTAWVLTVLTRGATCVAVRSKQASQLEFVSRNSTGEPLERGTRRGDLHPLTLIVPTRSSLCPLAVLCESAASVTIKAWVCLTDSPLLAGRLPHPRAPQARCMYLERRVHIRCRKRTTAQGDGTHSNTTRSKQSHLVEHHSLTPKHAVECRCKSMCDLVMFATWRRSSGV